MRALQQRGPGWPVTRNRSVEDLSVDELRRLLMEKRRRERTARLDRYRKTGRVIQVATPEETEASPAAANRRKKQASDETPAPPRSARRIWIDRLLTAVEVLAVLGLVFILLNGASMIRSLGQEVASAQGQPTAEPTAMISAVVLPSGHTPPQSGSASEFNIAEIPEHLRPRFQTMAEVPIPTTGPEMASHIRIPRIGVDQDIFQGDGWDQLKKGVGQHIGSANPGQVGNLVLSAHNDIYGSIFANLDQLEPGDEIIISTSQREYVYIVQQKQIVEPTRTDLLGASQEPIATLITCYPPMVDDQRVVVTAALQEQP